MEKRNIPIDYFEFFPAHMLLVSLIQLYWKCEYGLKINIISLDCYSSKEYYFFNDDFIHICNLENPTF